MTDDNHVALPTNIIKFSEVNKLKTLLQGEGGSPALMDGWMTDDKENPLNNLANVMVAFRSDPMLMNVIAFDAMLEKVVILKPLPGEAADGKFPRPFSDHDCTRMQEYIQHLGLCRVGKEVVYQAADARAQQCSFHPIRDYLKGNTWDKVQRLTTWLPKYLGAPDSPYTRGVGIMSMIGMVTRVMEPGCKLDYMMVWEGPQGIGKSTACAILGGQWFSDSMLPVKGHKDSFHHLAGKWIVEVSEMAAFTNGESSIIKGFLTGTVDQYRRAYGRNEVAQARQCVFIGTTNQSTYLRDETGARRFWPVTVGPINLVGLKADRNQLFAEAMFLYSIDLTGSFWTKRFARNCLGKEEGHAEEAVQRGADCYVASPD